MRLSILHFQAHEVCFPCYDSFNNQCVPLANVFSMEGASVDKISSNLGHVFLLITIGILDFVLVFLQGTAPKPVCTSEA